MSDLCLSGKRATNSVRVWWRLADSVAGVRDKAGDLLEVAKPLLEGVGAVGRCDRESLPEELQAREVAGQDGLAAVHVVADVSLDEDEHSDAVAVGRLVELVAERLTG